MTAIRHSLTAASVLALVCAAGAAVVAQTPDSGTPGGTPPPAPAPAPTPKATVEGPVSAEIRALRDADQADRRFTTPPTPEEMKKLVERDRERRKKVRDLLNDDKLVTPEDYDNAALIFQHGETPDDYLTAHELSIIAVMLGRFNSLPALSEDRFLDKVGRKQRFGTQFGMGKDNKLISQPVDGGQPTSVTDALRADFLVPTVKEWQKDGMNAVATSRNRIVARMRQRRDAKFREQASKRPIAAELKRLAAGKGPAGASRVLQIYRNDALWTPDDYYHAALVLNRRGDSAAWILAHELASVAAMQGKTEARRLAAETLDLFLVSIKQPQRYGTVPGKPTEGTVAASVRAHFGLKSATVPATSEASSER